MATQYPLLLQVVMEDRWRNRMAIIYENSSAPIKKRLVTISFTKEQLALLCPLVVGEEKGRPVFEEIGDSWIESIPGI